MREDGVEPSFSRELQPPPPPGHRPAGGGEGGVARGLTEVVPREPQVQRLLVGVLDAAEAAHAPGHGGPARLGAGCRARWGHSMVSELREFGEEFGL